MSVYDMFVLLYFALDSEYDENQNTDLDLFLSDANPFVFKGECSADPSVYEDFKSAYSKYGSDDSDGYSFVAEFVQNECNVAVKNAFSAVSKSDWIEAAKQYKQSKTA